MKRTQIYLPSEMHQKLAHEAKKRRITISALIRRRISQSVQPPGQQLLTRANLFQDLDLLSGRMRWPDVPKTLSKIIDKTLYG